MKINFLINHLAASQLAYNLIHSINNQPYDVNDEYTVFVEDITPICVPPTFVIMQLAEAWAQRGITIATNLSTALKLRDFPGPCAKFFYVWDLEWLRGHGNRYYEFYQSVYSNTALELIARSQTHADLLTNCFNRKVNHIIEDCNIIQFKSIINDNIKNKSITDNSRIQR